MLVPGLGPHRVVGQFVPVEVELAADEIHHRRRNELARSQQAARVAEHAQLQVFVAQRVVAQQVRLVLREREQGRPLSAGQNGSPSHSLSLAVSGPVARRPCAERRRRSPIAVIQARASHARRPRLAASAAPRQRSHSAAITQARAGARSVLLRYRRRRSTVTYQARWTGNTWTRCASTPCRGPAEPRIRRTTRCARTNAGPRSAGRPCVTRARCVSSSAPRIPGRSAICCARSLGSAWTGCREVQGIKEGKRVFVAPRVLADDLDAIRHRVMNAPGLDPRPHPGASRRAEVAAATPWRIRSTRPVRISRYTEEAFVRGGLLYRSDWMIFAGDFPRTVLG